MSDVDPLVRGVIRRLVAAVGRLQEESRQHARASQAANRSVEVGSQTVIDDAGVTRAVVGELEDGTYGVVTFGGDPPAAPSAPLVAEVPGGATVTWDGFDANDELGWPVTLDRVRVHLSTVPGDPPTQDTYVASIAAGADDDTWGGAVTFAQPADVTTYCTLVAVTASGVESLPSVEVPVTGGVGTFVGIDTRPGSPTEGQTMTEVDPASGILSTLAAIFTGGLFRTDTTGARVEISQSDGIDDVRLYTGVPEESQPGALGSNDDTRVGGWVDLMVNLRSPLVSGSLKRAAVRLVTSHTDAFGGSTETSVMLNADTVEVTDKLHTPRLAVGASRTLTVLDSGSTSGVTDADGLITFVHDLAIAGTYQVMLQSRANGGTRVFNVESKGANSVTFRVDNETGVHLGVGITIGFDWLVIA